MGEVGVAGVEEPAALGADRDAAVASGVAGEGDEEDVVGDEGADAFEVEPALALQVVDDPLGLVGEVRGFVAVALAECGAVHGGAVFVRENVHLGVREVWEAAGVVEVEVG